MTEEKPKRYAILSSFSMEPPKKEEIRTREQIIAELGFDPETIELIDPEEFLRSVGKKKGEPEDPPSDVPKP